MTLPDGIFPSSLMPRLIALIEERQRAGMTLPQCPGCGQPIHSPSRAGRYGFLNVLGPVDADFVICIDCLPKLLNTATKSAFTRRIMSRMARQPGKYLCDLHGGEGLDRCRLTLEARNGREVVVVLPGGCAVHDQEWFAAHPGRTARIRRRLPGEAIPGFPEPYERIVVSRTGPQDFLSTAVPEPFTELEDSEENAANLFQWLTFVATGRPIGESVFRWLFAVHMLIERKGSPLH